MPTGEGGWRFLAAKGIGGGKETLLTPYAALGKSEFRFKKGGLYKEVDLI